MAMSDGFRHRMLLVQSGPGAGMSYEINAPRIIVGRRTTGSNLDVPILQIDDARISRFHLEILTQPDGLYVRDLGSANGTWLNGRPLGGVPVRLEDGAEILLGSDSLLQFRLS